MHEIIQVTVSISTITYFRLNSKYVKIIKTAPIKAEAELKASIAVSMTIAGIHGRLCKKANGRQAVRYIALLVGFPNTPSNHSPGNLNISILKYWKNAYNESMTAG
jgi:hypothetical protein